MRRGLGNAKDYVESMWLMFQVKPSDYAIVTWW